MPPKIEEESNIFSIQTVLLVLTILGAIIAIIFDLPVKNSTIYMSISFTLLIFLIVTVIYTMYKIFTTKINKNTKILKIIFVFISAILIYSMVYLSLYEYDKNNFIESGNSSNNTSKKYLNMLYFTIVDSFSHGYSNYSSNSSFVKFISITQVGVYILLLCSLFSKAI